jgi:hypothetical protein
MLVARGLALAETNDMVDYAATEKQAETERLGLWNYR